MTAEADAADGATEAPAPEPTWGILDAVLGIVAAIVLSALSSGFYVVVTGRNEFGYGVAMASIAGLWSAFVGVPVLAARRKGSGSIVTDFGARLAASDIARGIGAGLGSQFLLLPLIYLPLQELLPDIFDAPGENAQELFDTAGGAGVAVMVAVLVIGAPLVEELFFRGLLQRSLVRRIGPVAGVAVGAVVFGFTHYDPAAFPGLVAFGLVLGWLAHASGRLGPAFVAHVAFNAATVGVFLATR